MVRPRIQPFFYALFFQLFFSSDGRFSRLFKKLDISPRALLITSTVIFFLLTMWLSPDTTIMSTSIAVGLLLLVLGYTSELLRTQVSSPFLRGTAIAILAFVPTISVGFGMEKANNVINGSRYLSVELKHMKDAPNVFRKEDVAYLGKAGSYAFFYLRYSNTVWIGGDDILKSLQLKKVCIERTLFFVKQCAS